MANNRIYWGDDSRKSHHKLNDENEVDEIGEELTLYVNGNEIYFSGEVTQFTMDWIIKKLRKMTGDFKNIKKIIKIKNKILLGKYMLEN